MKTKLETFINKNLPEVLKTYTTMSLGDRSKYIGASDIGSCLRKGYLSKTREVEYSMEQHIVFERGHLTEALVAKMLEGTPCKQQVEVTGKAQNGHAIKAHIDFVVDWGKECVVVEAKSTSFPVDEPYESWILQVQMQMGLLQSQCNGKKVRGYVLAIDVNTGWYKSFEVLQNKVLFNLAMNNAEALSQALLDQEEPEASIELYCSKCPFKGDCPAITKGCVEQLPKEIIEIVKKIASLSKVEKEIKSLKKQLLEFMESTNISLVRADDFTVSLMKKKGKKSVDLEMLKEMAPDIYSQVECYDRGYSYLQVV
ncbi:MAG: hypothetical protein WC656_01325 [Sulfurimonas sp.]|jgi:CRISPR-associated exonuclease Cas4